MYACCTDIDILRFATLKKKKKNDHYPKGLKNIAAIFVFDT